MKTPAARVVFAFAGDARRFAHATRCSSIWPRY